MKTQSPCNGLAIPRRARINCIALWLFVAAACTGLAGALDTWTNRDSGTTNDLYAITYGNGVFVAAGHGGLILTSTNGSDWMQQVMAGTTPDIRAAAFGNGTFALAGDQGLILTSPDGSNWTLRNSGTTNSFQCATFANDLFVAGANGSVARSTDGATWTHHIAPTRIRGLTFGKDGFVAVGDVGGTTSGQARILTSPDAIVWRTQPRGDSTYYGVTYGRDLFVALKIRGLTITSRDGVNWISHHPAGSGGYLYAITHAHDVFVAVGGEFGGGTRLIRTSGNGSNWTTRLNEAGPGLRAVICGNGSFVAVGMNGSIFQSGPIFTLNTRLSGSGAHLTLAGEAGRSYRIQTASSLGDEWVDLTTFSSLSDTTEFLDSAATNHPQRFYRVVSP